jgi:hypothetical protein
VQLVEGMFNEYANERNGVGHSAVDKYTDKAMYLANKTHRGNVL